MIIPRNLKPGDTICIVAPSRKVSRKEIELSERILGQWGLNVLVAKNLFADEHSYLAASDEHRAQDLIDAINDETIHAIIAARGGYGLTRILDRLDLSVLKMKPKWIIGFSDITALHLALLTHQIVSIHGPMPLLFGEAGGMPGIEHLKELLFSGHHRYQFDANSANRLGECEGKIVGGNLSLIVESLGTPSEIETENCILFIEEIDEYKYKVDRMLHQLRRAGKLANLAGLVVGHMTDIKDSRLPFGTSVENLVCDIVNDSDFPIAFNFPGGHAQPNLPFMHGARYSLSVKTSGTSLTSRSLVL